MARGAKNFVFLGRSGCDKLDARDLVNRLERNGALATVIRGGVSNSSDVNFRARLHCDQQADRRGHSSWHGPSRRAVQYHGHKNALGFPPLTSSVSGSVAAATESNYCSANGFLDAFARWRRSQSKKAVSIGFGMIAEVGYLHENSEIDALLLWKGLQALTEEEFLPEFAHLLTGLEPMGLRKPIVKGWDVNSGNMQDPRTSILSAALMADKDVDGGADVQVAIASAPEWLKAVPKGVAASFASEMRAASLLDAVISITWRWFSSLILTPRDQIDNGKPLTQFGMDSMIGAEFRTWILDLLSNQKALINIAEHIETKIGES
ncbi:hypothetical protein F5Y10DRAFT_269581 [Nemania abortiva]|nr:hypothetical protein F5Y10DRAFT_269581 [Nemania abortiva]